MSMPSGDGRDVLVGVEPGRLSSRSAISRTPEPSGPDGDPLALQSPTMFWIVESAGTTSCT